MYYYVSMVLMWSYVYCSDVEEWCLPSTEVETINQSINQSIAINSVGDCSESDCTWFRVIVASNYKPSTKNNTNCG